MLETIISSLIVAAVGGISWIAYQHPVGYARIYQSLILASTFAFTAFCAFSVGAHWGSSKLFVMLDSSRFAEATAITRNLDKLFFWLFIGYFALQGYFLFLRILPQLLRNTEEQKTNDEPLVTDEKKT